MKGPNLVKRNLLFLKHLYLRNFRNYEEASISFGSRLNIIYGNNGHGKTNILEAISLLSTGRSFRTQHISEAIQEGKTFFLIEAEILRDRVSQKVKLTFDGKVKKVYLGANEFSTFSPLLGAYPLIFSEPKDVDLIVDSPAHRRKFLNLHLAQSDPLYVHHLSRFWRAMKQRNCLLKAKTFESLDCWEAEMAQSAQYIYQARKTLLDHLKEPIAEYSKQLTSNEECVEMSFEPTYMPDAKDYVLQLKKMRGREKDLGFTLIGPHRDDVHFMINAKSARTFASEGQKKTIATALCISEWKHLAKRIEDHPLIAIDDFEGTLDSARQAHLNASLHSMGQVFLTTPTRPQQSIARGAHLLCVNRGNVVAEKILETK